jgi:hypothetical protein
VKTIEEMKSSIGGLHRIASMARGNTLPFGGDKVNEEGASDSDRLAAALQEFNPDYHREIDEEGYVLRAGSYEKSHFYDLARAYLIAKELDANPASIRTDVLETPEKPHIPDAVTKPINVKDLPEYEMPEGKRAA